jgi:hypothetical protein
LGPSGPGPPTPPTLPCGRAPWQGPERFLSGFCHAKAAAAKIFLGQRRRGIPNPHPEG